MYGLQRLFKFSTVANKLSGGSTPVISSDTASKPGYLNVTGSTLYSTASGSGWTTPVGNFSRPGTSISSTGAYGSSKSPGTFDIQMNTSRRAFLHRRGNDRRCLLCLEQHPGHSRGTTIPVQTVSVAAGQSKVLTFEIPVSAIPAGPVAGLGLLSITFGGGSPYSVSQCHQRDEPVSGGSDSVPTSTTRKREWAAKTGSGPDYRLDYLAARSDKQHAQPYGGVGGDDD